MARETKVGLLIGLGMILLIGIIVSDQLAMTKRPQVTSDGIQAGNPEHRTVSYNRGGGGQADRAAVPMPEAETGTANGNQEMGSPPTAFQLDDSTPPRLDDSGARRFGETVHPPGPTGRDMAPAIQGQSTEQAEQSDQAAEDTGPADQPRDDRRAQADPPSQQQPEQQTEPQSPTPPTQQPQSGQLLHTVQQNENLHQIARQYYNNGQYWPAIQQANPDKVTEDGKVRAGAELVIPDRAGRANQDDDNTGPSQIEQVRQAAETRTVEVRENDTLIGLARDYLGDRSRWRDFIKVNDHLDSARALRAGMTLKLPPLENSGGEQTRRTQSTDRREQPSPGNTAGTYTVKRNDTLYDIARKELGNGSAWKTIYQANRDKLSNPDDISVGMTLDIPAQ